MGIKVGVKVEKVTDVEVRMPLPLLKISSINSSLLIKTRLQQVCSPSIFLKIKYTTFVLLNRLGNPLDLKLLEL